MFSFVIHRVIFNKKDKNRRVHCTCVYSAYGSLTVRSLLDTREHCLEEFHFVDPYAQQKRDENEQALGLLRAQLASLDTMGWEARQLCLVEGMLAGNVFDWGAKEVATLMETSDFGFSQATKKLQSE